MLEIKHLTMAELEAGLDEIRRAPRDEGVLQLIVRRPEIEQRECLALVADTPILGVRIAPC